jgi:hypothetical protein
MTRYSRITLIIGSDGRAELGVVPSMASENRTAAEVAEAGSEIPPEATEYIAPETLLLDDAGTLQRVAEHIAATHGRLDLLILDADPRPSEPGPESPLTRHSSPFRFHLLASLMLLLPLLGRSRTGRVVVFHTGYAERAACGVSHLGQWAESAGIRLESLSLAASMAERIGRRVMADLVRRLDDEIDGQAGERLSIPLHSFIPASRQ